MIRLPAQSHRKSRMRRTRAYQPTSGCGPPSQLEGMDKIGMSLWRVRLAERNGYRRRRVRRA